jgi:pyruvate carboxylase
MPTIKKLLVANRSEIAIRVFRTAHELGIRTVAIYAYEDRFALHRFKADEAYLLGKAGEPIRSYLDINRIVALAKEVGADAIHPGYGFLSENPDFAKACRDAGMIFVGPQVDSLVRLGDKTYARNIAVEVGVPVLGGSGVSITKVEEGQETAQKLGYPIILKAAKGGGGRGMRVVAKPEDFAASYDQARRESLTAFGSPDIFVEKFIQRASHIEVQLIGDQHGNLVHLFERDCSVQRRHQKVVEIAPAPNLDSKIRDALCESAIKIGKAVNYECAGTVEFLVDRDSGQYYFIEVNPRIQVEHTVTEEVTGVDIVKTQLLVSQGLKLADPEIGLGSQSDVKVTGFALQCRVTTEDAANGFVPDYGRVVHYRSAGGMGIRLDAGTAFSGAVVSPFFDSMLVKVSARGRRFIDAVRRMERCLQEFRIRGVKSNIPFLLKVLMHPKFQDGTCTTRFIDESTELFDFPRRRDRATRLLRFLSDVIVNGNGLVKGQPTAKRRNPAPVPALDRSQPLPKGTRDLFKEQGVKGLSDWVKSQKKLLLTDTTFRDAHQSLFATRARTHDLLAITETYARKCADFFSLEMWGGATFDTSMRFLKECPWRRLSDMREKAPNILFQMLLRASNAVGYTNYPDNVVEFFVKEAAQAGIDVFRVFDSLNWTPNMEVAMKAVIDAGGICEAAICYTGDILNPKRTKYDLKYYVNLAKDLEKRGAHFLAIKDMAGLCKPFAARKLVETLRQEIGIPIHFHTHDTAGMQAASILNAAEVGLHIADGAMAPWSGSTSQPNLNAIVEALRNTPRDTGMVERDLDSIAEYWAAVREFYLPFETVMLPAAGDLYRHEMPGGQYTNLYQQAKALGLSERWTEVCDRYAEANLLLGDIVKVTPSSKSIGDLALFMVANELKAEDLLNEEKSYSYPESVLDLVGGRMGQPPGGFPEKIKARIMQGKPEVTGRPGESLPPADLAKATAKVKEILGREPKPYEVVTHLLYPKVYEDYIKHTIEYSDVSHFATPIFFYGPEPGEELAVDIEPGKTLIIKFQTIGEPHSDGTRNVFFELNGQPREVTIVDKSLEATSKKNVKADSSNPHHIGAAMPGMVVALAVREGDAVTKGQRLLSLEAMKMETAINADRDATVDQIHITAGTQVEAGDLLITLR